MIRHGPSPRWGGNYPKAVIARIRSGPDTGLVRQSPSPRGIRPMKSQQPSSSRKRVSSEDAFALWREYKSTGDVQVRNRLVMTYAPLVKYIVFKKARELPARCEV